MIEPLVEYFTSSVRQKPGAGQQPGDNGRPLIRASDIRELAEPVERLIVKYPAAALASAFLVGVVVAWWIKRK